tara:strand:- start:56 stop:250 length:195 start_codon:yes stop_codon:yes gene_type:complete
MTGNPNGYIILVETKDNKFKAVTNKLNVIEARKKLETINLIDEPEIIRAFIFNVAALEEEGIPQ